MSFNITAAGHAYKQKIEFISVGRAISADRELITRCVQSASARFQRCNMEIYDRPGACLRLKVWMLNAEVVETPLYGCVAWSLNKAESDMLRQVTHSMLLRCLSWRKRTCDGHTLSYADALAKTDSERTEATVRKRRTLFARFVARMGEERLSRRVMLGELDGGEGYSGGQEKGRMVRLEEGTTQFGMTLEGQQNRLHRR